MNPTSARRLAGAAFLLLAWSAAQNAAAVCVSNNSELAQALTNAESTAATIKIVQGTYDLHNSPWDKGALGTAKHIAAGSQVLGGYTANCTGRDIAVGNTVMTDSGANPQDSIAADGDLVIEGLTFTQSGFYLLMDRYIYGVANVKSGTVVQIRRNAFLNAEFGGFGLTWGQGPDAGGTIRLVDNLIAGNADSCSLRIDVPSGDPQVVWINNTIAANTGINSDPSGACFTNHSGTDGPDYNGNATLFAYNNIFYGNHAKDFVSDSSALVLVDNTISASTYPPPDTTPSGTLSTDPALDANYRPTEAPPSTAIDSGTIDVLGGLPATDLPGRDRVVGIAPDRGAFESAVNNAFLQPVTSSGSSGVGSLRAAIDGAIAHGSGLITFDLGAGCPQTITLNSALSPITVPLIINGYTQAGSSQNTLDVGDDATLCVIIKDGNNVGVGLQVPDTAADGTQVLISGLAFSGFSVAAIDLQAGSGHSITGNRFGGSVGGTALQPNGVGIRLGTAAHDATIGSVDSADRNIIGDATGSGILVQGGASPPFLFGAYNNQIINNYIGVGWNVNGDAYTNRANGTRGIHLLGHDNTISGNLIGNNVQAGILVSNGGAQNNLIAGNFIGADAFGIALGNGNAGIHLTGDSGDAPTANTIRNNVIANNGDQGVYIDFGTRNKVRKNSIYANGALGIDLAVAGITPNDNDGALIGIIDYANRGLNFPVLTSAAGGISSGYVHGTLMTTGGDYTVDLYLNTTCDSSGNGQGQAWLGGNSVSVPATQPGFQAAVDFDIRIDQPAANLPFVTGRQITATATDASGNTSEFSTCADYFNDTIFANGFEPPPA